MGDEKLHIELEIFYIIIFLSDSPDTEGEITSESPAVAKRKLKSEVDENALVAEYLKKVSPGIARKFQV